MGKFSIHNQVAKKTLECKVEGNMTMQDAAGFMSQYKQHVAQILPSQYILSFDCTGLGVSSKETQEKLAECFQLYKEAQFKQIVFHTGNNSILKMQLTRMANAVKLHNFSIE